MREVTGFDGRDVISNEVWLPGPGKRAAPATPLPMPANSNKPDAEETGERTISTSLARAEAAVANLAQDYASWALADVAKARAAAAVAARAGAASGGTTGPAPAPADEHETEDDG